MIPFLFTDCKPAINQNDTSAQEAIDTLPTDFVVFFDRFHADSAYQMEHITFPLEGMPNSQGESDTIPNERFYWQKTTWILHNPFKDPSNQFEHWYEVFDGKLIEHWIHMKGTNLFLQRRFAKLGDEWFLIYYAGMRPRSEKVK